MLPVPSEGLEDGEPLPVPSEGLELPELEGLLLGVPSAMLILLYVLILLWPVVIQPTVVSM